MGAEAEVRPKAERNMINAGAAKVELVRIVENVGVPIGGKVINGNLVASDDGLPTNLTIDGGRSPEVNHRWPVPQQLFDSAVE